MRSMTSPWSSTWSSMPPASWSTSAKPWLSRDGHWQAVLAADVTGALEAGSNQIAAIVVSKRALLPVTEVLQFVTQ